MDSKDSRDTSESFDDTQIRTITKWMNLQLKERNPSIITTALIDGKNLLQLFPVVFKDPAIQFEKEYIEIDPIVNASRVLELLNQTYQDDESLPLISRGEAVNRSTESIFALLFWIMLKYHFSDILPENTEGGLVKIKSALLEWIRLELKDYISNKVIPPITDFTYSWKSGLLFFLLIHRTEPSWVPDLVIVLQYIHQRSNWQYLLDLTFNIAQKKMKIPRYLETKDLLDIECPYELSIMLYVSEFYLKKKLGNFEENEEQHKKRLHDIYIAVEHGKAILEPEQLEKFNVNFCELLSNTLQSLDPLAVDLLEDLSDEIIFAIKNPNDQQKDLSSFRLLSLRFFWEQGFVKAVEWMSKAHLELSQFIASTYWSNREIQYTENIIENIIQNLVELESKISYFDKGIYCEILDFYHQMEDVCALPGHMKLRQSGFESAFEDLLKQASFGRKVVEQLLSIINLTEKFQHCLVLGEELRERISSDTPYVDQRDQDIYADSVHSFKQQSALLIQSAMSSIAYPSPPDMKTAMRTNDLYTRIEMAKGIITSAINSYSASLSLLVESLDETISSRHCIIHSQQKAHGAQRLIKMIQLWHEEKIKLIMQFDLNSILFSYSLEKSVSSSEFSVGECDLETDMWINEEGISKLEKECEQTLDRLIQIENEDILKLEVTVLEIRNDVNKTIGPSFETLKDTHQNLKRMLIHRSLQINALQHRFEWELKWAKYNNQLVALAKRIGDFNVRRARYNPTEENIDKPSYKRDYELIQSFEWMQDRLGELNERPWLTLLDAYRKTTVAYLATFGSSDENLLPKFISIKQSDIQNKNDDLKQLFIYTSDLMSQRVTIIEFLIRVKDAYQQGEKIKDLLSKRLRRMNEVDSCQISLQERVEAFKKNIKNIWSECGENMPYPLYSGNWLRQHSNEAAATYRAHLRTQIKSLLDKKMQNLLSLKKSVDLTFITYQEANRMKILVTKYEQEAKDLQDWIDEHIEKLRARSIEVSAELVIEDDISSLKSSRKVLLGKAEIFEHEKVKSLHDRVLLLVDASTRSGQSVNTNTALRQLGSLMTLLDRFKKELSDQGAILEAAEIRATWERSLKCGISCLEEMNGILADFSKKKSCILSNEDLREQDIQSLESDLKKTIILKADFEKTTLTSIHASYEAFIDCFFKLPKPMAVPDHLEVKMESFEKKLVRLDDLITAGSKELELVKNKMNLEFEIKLLLKNLSEVELSINQFIEQKARWNTSKVTDNTFDVNNNEEKLLRTKSQQFYEDISGYEQQTFECIKLKFETFSESIADYGIYLAPSKKKLDCLETTIGRIKLLLSFLNDAISQRCLVSALILRSNQLEQSAELIREELVATSNILERCTAVLLGSHTERLRKFKTSIEDVKCKLAISIPYPVRSISADTKILDEAVNSAIREIVNTKKIRLNELQLGLEETLTAREHISRRCASVEAFKKQVTTTKSWINGCDKVLNDYSDAVSIEALEKALVEFISIKQAMKANGNSFKLLTLAYDSCSSAFNYNHMNEAQNESVNYRLLEDFTNFVNPTFTSVKEKWEQLTLNINVAYSNKSFLLTHEKLKSWLKSAKTLLDSICTANDGTDSSILDSWQCQFTDLELLSSKYKVEMDLYTSSSTMNQLQTLSNLYCEGLETICKIRLQISICQKNFKLSQVTTKFTYDLELLLAQVWEYCEAAKNIEDSYRIIVLESDTMRKERHLCFLSEYKKMFNTVISIKNSHDDITLQLEKDYEEKSGHLTDIYITLKQAWAKLLFHESNISSLLARISLWTQHLNSLSSTGKQIESIMSHLKLVSNIEELEKLSQQVVVILKSFSYELYIFSQELIQDRDNMEAYKKLHSKLFEMGLQVQTEMLKRIKDLKKKNIVEIVQKRTEEISTTCEKQTNAIKYLNRKGIWLEDCQAALCLYINGREDTLEIGMKTLDQNRLQLDELKSIQCDDLASNYGYDDAYSLLLPSIRSLQLLHKETTFEKQQLAFFKETFELSILEKQVVEHASNIVKTSFDDERPSTAILEIEYHMEILSEKESLFTDYIKSLDFKKATLTEDNRLEIKLYIEQRQKYVVQWIAKAKKKAQDTACDCRVNLEYQRVVSKLEGLVDALKKVLGAHADKKHQSQAAFNTTYHQYKSIVHAKEAELCDLEPINFTKFEEAKKQKIRDLYENKERLMRDFDKLLADRRKEKALGNNAMHFEELISDFEQEISLLDKAIENTSFKNVNDMNDKSTKPHLQRMLRTLVNSYKHHQPKITCLLDQIREESKTHSLRDKERLDQWLVYGTKRATTAKSNAISQERELQNCINQLNNEFFKTLAVSRPQHVLPLTHHHSSYKKSKESLPFEKKNAVSSAATASSKNKSTSDTSSKKSMSLCCSSQTKGDIYIPDPKNALDVELSNIVNASPNRVTIKMIPGEVGKYWFGDVNPRLVYCRILTSQMVMVRVGGGWVELSKFLKDHGLSEGKHKAIEASLDSVQIQSPFQQSFLQTTRSLSSTHNEKQQQTERSTLAVTKSSSKSSKSSLPGYFDGDRFFSTNEAGKNLVTIMKKAENDAKMPLLKKNI